LSPGAAVGAAVAVGRGVGVATRGVGVGSDPPARVLADATPE
jgi:hypothetical protein